MTNLSPKLSPTRVQTACILGFLCLASVVSMPSAAFAQHAQAPDQTVSDPQWQIHFQTTVVDQANNRFSAPYSGANSLSPSANGRETFDTTLYLGRRLWSGAEIWLNPEIDQGFGLSNTLGMAGFPSGEAYKVGKTDPYLKLPRFFIRQNFDLGGESETLETDLNQFTTTRTKDHLTLTFGKFSVPDIFDNSVSAHDPRHDFLNWSVLDTGSFDYAADAWGYTYGTAAELTKGSSTTRLGLFDMSDVPNSPTLDGFHQMQAIAEFEQRYQIAGHDGSARLTGFLSRARMAKFSDILAGTPSGETPDPIGFRRYRSRTGLAFSADQSVSDTIALFMRAGHSDGRYETYEFSDIDQTIALGASYAGKLWQRDADHMGLAVVDNAISRQHAAFLAAGGLGPLIGDGQLPHRGDEHIVETYYSFGLNQGTNLSLDYQYVENPAYNKDRGPVSLLGVRLHVQY